MLCRIFGQVRTRSKENPVASRSLNYTESYEIYVETRGLFSFI